MHLANAIMLCCAPAAEERPLPAFGLALPHAASSAGVTSMTIVKRRPIPEWYVNSGYMPVTAIN
jgi:hypothetical protein